MAILTTAQARHFVGLPATATDDDTLIDTLVGRADQIAARWLDWPSYNDQGAVSLTQQTYTLYLTGPGGRFLRLPIRPIVSITSIEDDTGEDFDGSTYLVSSSDYRLDKSGGRVILDVGATPWSSTEESEAEVIKVVASCGFTTTPDDLVHGVGAIVRALWDLRMKQGEQTRTDGDFTITLRDETIIPPHAREVLNRYRAGWFA